MYGMKKRIKINQQVEEGSKLKAMIALAIIIGGGLLVDRLVIDKQARLFF